MNYEQMSDFEINAEITQLEHNCKNWEFDEKSRSFSHCGLDGEGFFVVEVVDYCNSWADMGPIIPSIMEDLFRKPEWCLLNNNLWEYWTDASGGNMCRAAAIVYLMSKESV